MIASLQTGLAAMLAGIGWLTGKLDPSMINMPNKEYWLHEDRREETVRHHQSVRYWIGAWTALLMVVVFQLTLEANLAGETIAGEAPAMNAGIFWGALIVYLLIVTALCARMFLRFSKIPAPAEQ